MKTSNVMPTEGQFVAVWEASGHLGSHVFRWNGNQLQKFSTDRPDFWVPYSIVGFPFADELLDVLTTYITKD